MLIFYENNAIIGQKLIGPIIFERSLTGEWHLGFLETEIEGYLENLPLAIRNNVYFQHHGALSNTGQVIQYLNGAFPNKWMETNEPIKSLQTHFRFLWC